MNSAPETVALQTDRKVQSSSTCVSFQPRSVCSFSVSLDRYSQLKTSPFTAAGTALMLFMAWQCMISLGIAGKMISMLRCACCARFHCLYTLENGGSARVTVYPVYPGYAHFSCCASGIHSFPGCIRFSNTWDIY